MEKIPAYGREEAGCSEVAVFRDAAAAEWMIMFLWLVAVRV